MNLSRRLTVILLAILVIGGTVRPALSQIGLNAKERRAASRISQTVSATEWLGPMAPVALSPFFGITCLSGMAIFGEDYLPGNHWITTANTPLKNPLVFCVFLTLTVVTSLPKFSKVSKPFAQSVDRIEAYAAIITLMVIRYLGSASSGGPEIAFESSPVVHHAGVVDLGVEGLLAVAMAINILVINAVKFFCEMVVWITPIPLIDAAFEAGNKIVCAALMGLYVYSPLMATCVNLGILFVCLLVFLWVRRREVFFRSLLMDVVATWLKKPSHLPTAEDPLVVFPTEDVGPISKLAKCELTRKDSVLVLRQRRWLGDDRCYRFGTDVTPQLRSGWIRNRLEFGDVALVFGRRYNHLLDELTAELGAVREQTEVTDEEPSVNASVELA